MPLRIGNADGDLTGDSPAFLTAGIGEGAKIVNASFGERGWVYGEYEGATFWLRTPGLLAYRSNDAAAGYRNLANEYADAVRGEDAVVVFAAGNSGWHPGGRLVIQEASCNDAGDADCRNTLVARRIDIANVADFTVLSHTNGWGEQIAASNFDGFFAPLTDRSFSSYQSNAPLWAVDNYLDLAGGLNAGRMTRAEFNAALNADADYSALLPRWLAVVATDRNNRIASFSNGCGLARMWCLAAPGVDISTTHSDGGYIANDGTSFAAPHVSGALALLKSARPSLPMTDVRMILLETATDLGDPGVDQVYGWGLVNVSAGIAEVLGINSQMAAIADMNAPRLGFAAAAANGNRFAAAADGDALRFWGGLDTARAWTGAATREYGGLSAFGEAGRSELEMESFLANGDVRGAESESWSAGFRYSDVFQHKDRLQISARQESRITDGELVLQYSFGSQIRIPIRQRPATVWTASYSRETDGGMWSAAAEWNAATDDVGVSFAAELEF